MYFEVLALEVNAKIAGLEIVKPALLKGNSGTDHKFTFLAMDGAKAFGFDIYPQVGELEILRAFVKKLDTGAESFVICLSGRPSEDTGKLASLYDVTILGPGEVGNFFSEKIAQQVQMHAKKRA